MCGVTLTQNRYTSVRLSDVFLQGVKAIITIEKFNVKIKLCTIWDSVYLLHTFVF